MARLFCLTLACASLLAWPGLYQPAHAGERSRVERRPAAQARVLIPAAGASSGSDAAVLSGLDYTALAPPGERLRVIEDEPYIYTTAEPDLGNPHAVESVSAISLVSDRTDGGNFEARISLRLAQESAQQYALIESFDAAAHSVYRTSMATVEERGETAYSLHEVRSPLGLVHPRDKYNSHREYLAYSAAVINPVGIDTSELATPYRYVNGQLKFVRKLKTSLALVTIEFTAREYPHSLTLVENLARAVVNRLDDSLRYRERMQYLAYQPEFEPALPYFVDEPIGQRTADLAEQPGEGCGREALPITGDICPACGDELKHDPATPHTGNLLELLGPQIYRAECAEPLQDATPFPPTQKCYFKFVQHYNLDKARHNVMCNGNSQRCRIAGLAVQCLDSTAVTEGDSVIQPDALPPELLSRLHVATELASLRVIGPEQANGIDPLADGITVTSTK